MSSILIGFHFLERAPSCFQLIGLDFMISTDWNIWFIEANGSPGSKMVGYMVDFHHNKKVNDSICTSLYTRFLVYKVHIIMIFSLLQKDMLDLVLTMRQTPQIFLDMPVGEWFRSWQLIWRKNPPNYLLDKYDPLHEFNDSN